MSDLMIPLLSATLLFPVNVTETLLIRWSQNGPRRFNLKLYQPVENGPYFTTQADIDEFISKTWSYVSPSGPSI